MTVPKTSYSRLCVNCAFLTARSLAPGNLFAFAVTLAAVPANVSAQDRAGWTEPRADRTRNFDSGIWVRNRGGPDAYSVPYTVFTEWNVAIRDVRTGGMDRKKKEVA